MNTYTDTLSVAVDFAKKVGWVTLFQEVIAGMGTMKLKSEWPRYFFLRVKIASG